MEFEWSAGEEVGDAGVADNDFPVMVVRGDDASGWGDWFSVVGAVVDSFEGGGGGFGRGVL